MKDPAARRYRRALASLMTLLAASSGVAQVTTTGYQNVQRNWAPGTLLSHPLDADNGTESIGRTTTVNYFRGWLIVAPEEPGSRSGSDNNVRVFDISDPTAPIRRLPSDFGHTYTNWYTGNYGWNAHGTAQTPDTFYISALTAPSFGGPISRGINGTNSPLGYSRSFQAGPWSASFPWYGTPDANFTFGRRYKTGTSAYTTVNHATFDHVGNFGGGDWHPMVFGDLLIYARSDASSSSVVTGRDGVVVYRLQYNNFTDPVLANRTITPQLVGTLSKGFSAYWPNLFSDGTRLYVVGASSGTVQVADVTNAAEPGQDGSVTLVADYSTPLSNATYPVYQDNYAFIHNKKFDMTRLVGGNANPVVLTLDESAKQAVGETTVHASGIDTSQMSLPLGNLWLTGGYPGSGQVQGMAIWLQQQAPDTTKPYVAYHIPQKFRGNYPRFAPLSFLIHETPRDGAARPGIDFTVRPVNADNTLGAHVPGFAIHDMSGVFTYTPDAALAADTTYQVDFLSDPSQNIGFRDAAGNYMDAYSFRFSTGGLSSPPAPAISGVTAGSYQPAIGASTTISVNATGTGLQYRFNSNGTWTDWSTSNSTSVSFSAAGRYRVMVQVKNSDGVITTSFVNILVPAGGALANAPTHSNTLAIGQDPAGRRVWVVNPDSDTVSVLDASTGAKITNGEYKVGKNPRSIARDKNGRYWVTVMGEDKIVILNPDGTVHQTLGGGNTAIPYGAAPFAVAPNHDGSLMFVSYYGLGRLARFTVPDGAATVANPTISSSTTPVPTARAIAVRYDGTNTRVFVTRFISTDQQGEVHEFNGTSTSLSRTRTFTLGYNVAPDAGDNGAGVPNYLAGIAITPDGKYAIVTAKKDNITRGLIYTDPNPPSNHPVGVGDLTPINTVRAMMTVLDLTANNEASGARRDFDNSDSPTSVTFSSRGDTAFIALQGNNRIVGIDSFNLTTGGGSALVTLSAGTGLAPQGVLYDATSKRLFAQNFMGRSVSMFDATNFHDVNQSSFAAPVTTNTVAAELLNPLVLEGKRLFYNAADPAMSLDSYISCATCHVDGGHDGRVWDFTGRGEGLRRTTDLRGRAGMAHGNVHWSANFDEIEDFEHDIRDAFGGSGFLPLTPAEFAAQHPDPSSNKKNAPDAEELNALAAYVSSLGASSVPRSPHRQASGAYTTTTGSSAVAGKLLFEGQGTPVLNCVTCHSGSKLTDSIVAPINGVLLDNVGTVISDSSVTANSLSGKRLGSTLAGIDVPSLLGLHASRVYLHHGMAGTLDEVFSFARGKVYQAESATPVFLYRAPTVRLAGIDTAARNQAVGGGGSFRGAFGAKAYQLITDIEDLNSNGVINTGEDVNSNGVLDTNPDHTAIRFTGVDGGSGGVHTLRIRYSNSSNFSLMLKVNDGAESTVAVTGSSLWRWHEVDVTLNAGTGNTIQLRRFTSSQNPTIDAIMVVSPADKAAAAAHRQVLDLDATKKGDLLAYLRQLDGRDENGALRDPDLVLHYKFDEGSGTSIGDTSLNGNDHTTTVSTAAWTTSGRFGAAYGSSTSFPSFFPANQADLDFDPRGDAYSISVWVKMSAGGSYRTIFSKGTSTAASRQYHVWTGGSNASLVGYSGGTMASALTVTPALDDGNWHLVTFVNFNDNGTWKTRLYYNNGTTYREFATGTSGKVTHQLRIGEMSTGYNRMLGFIDDLRIYKRALTPAEIAQLYAGQEPIAP